MGLGTLIPSLFSSAYMLDPAEIILEQLPAGLGTSIPSLPTTAGCLASGEGTCEDSRI